jgi:hypothetical protein
MPMEEARISAAFLVVIEGRPSPKLMCWWMKLRTAPAEGGDRFECVRSGARRTRHPAGRMWATLRVGASWGQGARWPAERDRRAVIISSFPWFDGCGGHDDAR